MEKVLICLKFRQKMQKIRINKRIFKLFPQLKKKISIEELKGQKRIKHKIELKNKVLSAEHLVIKDKFSGGITGCIIFREAGPQKKS
jgi:hypothetical protein